MNLRQILLIGVDEWRYWSRSYLVLGAILIFFVLVVATSIITALRFDMQQHVRTNQQSQAEETFHAQPDRHPHRMVHYGHYVFRAPAPLEIFDPGIDSIIGQSIFLEGHRQNTTMFAENAASADLGSFSWLTPAVLYQLFAPLIIILIGHSAIIREREAGVLVQLLAQGVSGYTIVFGKGLALLAFTLLLLIPLIVSSVIAISNGENPVSLILLFSLYCIYLTVWVALTLIVSAVLSKSSIALALLTGIWFSLTLVLPSVAVNLATYSKPIAGKIETDFAMLKDIRKLGDGHNASDPAFKQLRSSLLEKYKVDNIEDLPINFRGMVAMEGEKKLTEVLNDYADSRMSSEKQQQKMIASYAWVTPTLAIGFISRSIAGTDLEHYHRFQKEAERLRFDFVQSLNQAHIEKLSYLDDIKRNKDKASGLRARIDASNWQEALSSFEFRTANLVERFVNASATVSILLVWLVLLSSGLLWCGGRMSL